MLTLSKKCDSCNNVYSSTISSKKIKCDKCKEERFLFHSENLIFKRCSFCNSKEFYKRKDFNQKLGCLFVVIGSLLLPFTYGISLVVVLIIEEDEVPEEWSKFIPLNYKFFGQEPPE